MRRGLLLRFTDDHQRRARLVPAGEVVEVGVLAVGVEVERRPFGGKQDRYAAVEFCGQRHAARVVRTGGLLFEGVQSGDGDGDGEQGKQRGSQ